MSGCPRHQWSRHGPSAPCRPGLADHQAVVQDHRRLQLRPQVRAPAPQRVPQGLDAVDTGPRNAQPAPGQTRSVPRKIGGSLRVRAVTRCSGCGQTTASWGAP